MVAKTPIYLVTAEPLDGYGELVRELGGDPDDLLRQAGLNPASLIDSQNLISFQSANALLELTAKFVCPHFGLLLAARQPPLQEGPIGQLVRFSPDLGSAIQAVERLFPARNQGGVWQLQVENNTAILRRQNRLPPDVQQAQWYDCSLVGFCNAIRGLIGRNWRPSAVYFARTAPADLVPYRRVFDAPLQFDQEFYGLVFPASDLERPIPTADPALLRIVERHLQTLMDESRVEDDPLGNIRLLIQRSLASGHCNLETIATHVGLHPKRLQRLLRANGTSFRDLLKDTRHAIARNSLEESDISLTQLARTLGYNDLAAFSRAFKACNGLSPEAWRRQHRSSGT